MTEPLLITLAGAREYLGVSRVSLERLINEGAVTSVKIGRRHFVTRASLDDYVSRLATAP